MATLTLKNVPKDLHERLRQQARSHRRSLNREVIDLLATAVGDRPVTPEELRSFVAEQEAEGIWVNEEDVRRFITEGRP